MAPLRFGIMGTAGIACKFVLAARAAGAENIEVVAVASRDATRAREWAAAQGLSSDVTCHGSYEALLADSNVEAVYIPLPTTMHKTWSLAAIAAGKHVLCEKPVAASLADVLEMTAAARAAGLVWMDGVMFMHHTRLPKMLGDVAAFGGARRVTTLFSFPGDPAFLAGNIRVKADLEPLGCIGDLGWYNARFSLAAFNWEVPTAVSAVAHASTSEGVPLEATGTMFFSSGRIAMFDTGFTTAFRQFAEVAGPTSVLRLDDFVIARGPESASYTLTHEGGLVDTHRRVGGTTVTHEVLGCCQEAAMLQRFARLVAAARAGGVAGDGGAAAASLPLGEALETPGFWRWVAAATQAVMDAAMASVAAGGAKVPLAPLPASV